MRYKISFYLNSPISFTFKPIFDDLLLYCYIIDKHGYVPQPTTMTEENIIKLPDELLKKHNSGVRYCSYMMFEDSPYAESKSFWVKRFNQTKPELIKQTGKIDTQRGFYKSYKMPLRQIDLEKVWFIFDTENKSEVERLCGHIHGIGKKRNQGMGEVERFEIKESDGKIIRPVPVAAIPGDKLVKNLESIGRVNKIYTRIEPPYWSQLNAAECVEFDMNLL